jgi:carboxyl-terminal processing protease
MTDSGRKRRVRFTIDNTAGFRLSRSVIFLIFFAVAAVGYLAGTYNTQIAGAVLPVFGVKTYSGTLDVSSLQQTYQQLKANFDGTLDDQTLIDGANKGLVAAANDTYTLYLNKRDAKAFNDDLTGTIGGGIGAEIALRNNVPTVVGVLDNNPAKAAGLQNGDVIVKINGDAVTGQTVDQVVAKIRGDVGTSVKLDITRGGQAMTFTITRATVNNPSVASSVSNGLGIMTISRFDEKTADQARTAAQSFKSQGVKAVILDLRDNGGGYLDAAQAVAGLWLNDKEVVSEKTNGKTVDTLYSTSNPILADIPTVVLVNGNSASASEIVTGALKDYKVATIIGDKTFGKGSVQKLIDLGNGAELKVTVAKWYTPNGLNINQQGITPDKVVDLTNDDANAGRDPQLAAAKQQLGF